MKLYFLRHGEADWPNWTGSDDERPLTDAGKKELRRVAKFLTQIGVAPSVILSSPLLRAVQTAEIAQKQVGGELVTDEALASGATARGVRALLKKHGAEEVMLVGHEPDFSALVHAFTGGTVKMAKAGVARVDLDDNGKGRLIWLLPPKVTAR